MRLPVRRCRPPSNRPPHDFSSVQSYSDLAATPSSAMRRPTSFRSRSDIPSGFPGNLSPEQQSALTWFKQQLDTYVPNFVPMYGTPCGAAGLDGWSLKCPQGPHSGQFQSARMRAIDLHRPNSGHFHRAHACAADFGPDWRVHVSVVKSVRARW